ncbi:MAG: hypothetical protein L6R41_007383 [Letrouitia leprolyta]|nr:MAG: hypothetical protein L6R41_007383 [Letrouitia leprolyta]
MTLSQYGAVEALRDWNYAYGGSNFNGAKELRYGNILPYTTNPSGTPNPPFPPLSTTVQKRQQAKNLAVNCTQLKLSLDTKITTFEWKFVEFLGVRFGRNHAYTAQHDNQLSDNNNQPTSPAKFEANPVQSSPDTPINSQPVKTEEGTFEDGPPSKRRKTADTAPSQTPPAKLKHPSPPWKRFVPEGPSTFEEDGKRKSARTNPVPLELQPQGEKRQTRARLHQQSQPANSKYAGASNYGLKLSVKSPHQSQVNGKRSLSSAKTSAYTHLESPSKGGAHNGNKVPLANHTPVKRQYRRRTLPATAPSPTSSPSAAGLQSRVAGRKSEKRSTRRKRSPTLANGRDKSQEDEEDEEGEDEGGEDEDDDEEIESDSDLPVGENYKPQRLNLRVRLPSAKIQHPEQVPRTRRFASFRDWFEGEGSQDPDIMARKPQHKIQEEADLRRTILEEAKPGGLLSREKSSLYAPEVQDEPPRQYAHYDHLVAHMSYFRKLLQRENDAHKKQARALANEAAELWRSRQPKTEEEIQQEREAAYRAVYKQVRRDLQNKWDMVAAEVDRRRLQQWEEEQQLLGKEALNKVLEKSTKLLDKRRRRNSTSAAGSISDETREGSERISESSEVSGESQDEDNMSSSSQSDDGSVSENDVADDDEGLIREQLLQKYAKVKSSSTSVSPTLENRKAQVHDPGGTMTTTETILLNDNPTPLSPTIDDRPIGSPMEVDEVDEVLMDNSDDSTDMDDEMDNSDEDGSSGSDNSDDEESDTSERKPGLLGFFSKNELFPAQEDNTPQMQLHEAHEDTKEPFYVPNAAQVQTPSASNSEEPTNELLKTVTAAQAREASPLYNLMNVNSVDHMHEDSLPTTPVSTKPLKTSVPSLLRGTLREYQHFGLDWLAGLYANGTNGILADEMGLGKTIQTIALLAHLAVHHEIWGPHLIIVPTSVMLNWEMEFKKFFPGFKILTYYGTQEERRLKRQGCVSDSEKYNVWITSYQLASKDEQVFKRRAWHYMILDEAHNIKNFRSKRWQILLTFNTKARLLLTGTPL